MVMSKTKEYYLETLGIDTASLYDDVEYNNPPLDLFLDAQFECELSEQEIYEAELLNDYLRDTNLLS
jgi:hypothetical protein